MWCQITFVSSRDELNGLFQKHHRWKPCIADTPSWIGHPVRGHGGCRSQRQPRPSEIFTWTPGTVGLSGAAFTADAISFADYDQIVQAADNTTFTEAGYLPITGSSLLGQAIRPAGFNDPDGAGWGAYLRIAGSGPLVVSAIGVPEPVYEQLSYQLVGFNGLASYGFAADGAVAVGGTTNDLVTLATGSLISAGFTFAPSSPDGLTIDGGISLTVDEVAPRFATGQLDILNLRVVHPPSDYSFIPPSTIRVAAATGTDGTFAAAAAVPEPASAALLGAGLLVAALHRERQGRRAVQSGR